MRDARSLLHPQLDFRLPVVVVDSLPPPFDVSAAACCVRVGSARGVWLAVLLWIFWFVTSCVRSLVVVWSVSLQPKQLPEPVCPHVAGMEMKNGCKDSFADERWMAVSQIMFPDVRQLRVG